MCYTIGQRQGLGVGGRKGANDEPWYVADKDIERNVLIVVQGQNHPRLLSSALETEAMHWLTRGDLPHPPIQAQIRHRQRPVAVDVEIRADGTAKIEFLEPQRAVTPGQFAVLYAGDRCLGGAAIRRALPQSERAASLRAHA
jgi:tRNA-specific 2-thiouridylase